MEEDRGEETTGLRYLWVCLQPHPGSALHWKRKVGVRAMEVLEHQGLGEWTRPLILPSSSRLQKTRSLI